MKHAIRINIICVAAFCLTGLLNCKSTSTDPVADPGARVTGDPAWYFSGNPGVLTTAVYENVFRVTGQVGGQPFAIDETNPGWNTRVYNNFNNPATDDPAKGGVQTYLFAGGTNGQYDLGLYLRLPVQAGTLRVVNTNGEFDGPGVAPGARVTLTTNTATRRNLPVDVQEQTMQISSVTPDWIEGTYSFYVGTDRQTTSRLAFRFRNYSTINETLKPRSGDEADWNYGDATRKVAFRAEVDSSRSTGQVTVLQTVPFVEIQHANVPVGLSKTTLNDQGLIFVTQTTRLLSRSTSARTVEIVCTNQPTKTGFIERPVQLTITLPDFKGVGTYPLGQSQFMITQTDATSGNQWTANTAVGTAAGTQGMVTVTKVTGSVIEGTYSLTDAPVTTTAGVAAPASVKLTGGTFRVIYPR